MALEDRNKPIQLQPSGLLGLLQLKNNGRNPSVLADSVQPVLDLWPHYLLTNGEQTLSANIAVAGPGGAGPAVPDSLVPEGECWAVQLFSISMNGVLGVGQELSIMTMIEYGLTSGGGGIGVGCGDISRVFTNGDIPHATANIPGCGYLLIPPTAQLYVWAGRVTGGPFNVNIRARFTRLPL